MSLFLENYSLVERVVFLQFALPFRTNKAEHISDEIGICILRFVRIQ